ncbi:unnamed protein product [Chilo suppressalis]|uniref:Uncharacterized protein n=1 Tax=Chilo suppressalis TaxID=168631 RepID=A0ABN8B9P0_CHISP|nr:unnamed protein product [Chilo suppressalis]
MEKMMSTQVEESKHMKEEQEKVKEIIIENNKGIEEGKGRLKVIKEMKERAGKRMEEEQKKLTELGTKIEKVRKEETYAEKVRSVPPQNKTLHSIIVASTDETLTSDQVFDAVGKSVDENGEWNEVRRVRKAKGQKVIIGYTKESEAEKLKEKIERNKILKVERAKNKYSLVIVRNVRGERKKEEVIEG